jgi:hypothetical protein
MLDLLVFGMWPIITARRLPTGWQSDLAALTSPSVAVLVDRARVSMRGGSDYAAEEFASAVAQRDYLFAIVSLFEDLAGQGAAQLTAMAVAGEIENRRVYGRKERFLWAVGIASGGVVLGEIVHHGQAIAEFAAEARRLPMPSIVWRTPSQRMNNEAGDRVLDPLAPG